MEISLKIRRATPESIQEFGRIVLPNSRAADDVCENFNWWGNLAELALGENAEVGIVEAVDFGSFEQKELEQHQRTVEVMIPIENDIFIVAAKPDAFSKDAIDPSDFAAFYAPVGSMVILNEGVWHQAPMTLAKHAKTFILFRGNTGTQDKDVLKMADLGLRLVVAGI